MCDSNCRSRLTGVTAAFAILLFAGECFAIPTFIGVTSGVQRQTGGNPGTYTILMNQNYATLHASLGISINGAPFKEYAMTFDGSSGKNFRWVYTPAAVYPANASLKYYFRGWDDAGGNIFDGTTSAPYAFVAVPPSLISVPGDVDMYGSSLTVGSLLDDLNRAVFYLLASDAGNTSLVRFGASRNSNDWLWERGGATPSSPPVPMMKLDSSNRLTLFDSAAPNAGTILLDPTNPPGILIGGQRVLTTTSAATSYLPLNPIQLAVGVNNTTAADSLAVGTSAQATGQNSAAFGSSATASGMNAAAIGDHTTAQGFGQFVTGAYNVPQGTGSSFATGDQLFVVGNGTDGTHRSNALTILRNGNIGVGTAVPSTKLDVNGNAKINGNLQITGAIGIAPQGDLSMGEFTQGQSP